MAHEHPLTDEELEHLLAGALDQLADSVREYNDAKRAHAAKRPNQQLAVDRFNVAKESLRISIRVYDSLRDEIERRYRGGNPV